MIFPSADISDDEDVIPINPEYEIIDLTGDTVKEEITTPEYEKSQRKAHINKIFSTPSMITEKPANPSSPPQYPKDIGGVRVHIPVKPYRCQINVMSKVSVISFTNFIIYYTFLQLSII